MSANTKNVIWNRITFPHNYWSRNSYNNVMKIIIPANVWLHWTGLHCLCRHRLSDEWREHCVCVCECQQKKSTKCQVLRAMVMYGLWQTIHRFIIFIIEETTESYVLGGFGWGKVCMCLQSESDLIGDCECCERAQAIGSVPHPIQQIDCPFNRSVIIIGFNFSMFTLWSVITSTEFCESDASDVWLCGDQ